MAENLFASFDISGQGLSVQRKRLNAIARNIANANTTRTSDGGPYKREMVAISEVKDSPFSRELSDQMSLSLTNKSHLSNYDEKSQDNTVVRANIAQDGSTRKIYDPQHPDADGEGYVEMPNINIVTEMVEMISAQRSFEANTQIVEAAKNMARDSLEI